MKAQSRTDQVRGCLGQDVRRLPIPASGGKASRMRLNRGGNRQAKAAICRAAAVRMGGDGRMKAHAERRTAEGKTRREIVRRIKRPVIRKMYRHPCVPQERVGTNGRTWELHYRFVAGVTGDETCPDPPAPCPAASCRAGNHLGLHDGMSIDACPRRNLARQAERPRLELPVFQASDEKTTNSACHSAHLV
ncbi:hypothetical protein [Mangrovicoccus ximenensis]|uniref:hypothetical protein n=1 Tax=Mangrovicoccus ximenensis TaxID=1911570 RepID=UPI00191C6752|nr:hypothetical protein [Mangrovicoccus ximenensis]